MTQMLMLHPQSDARTFEPVGRATAAVDLNVTVRDKVIPRLCQALESALARPRHPLIGAASTGFDGEVEFLAARLLDDDLASSLGRIDALRRADRTLAQIYLQVLAPTACHLRDLWSDDLCGLAEATIAFYNLQSILRYYACEFYGEAYSPDTGLRALLVSPSQKGSTADVQLFGVLLLSEFFRRDGWDAWIERSFSSGRFRDTVLSGWFDLVEILATSDKELDEVASGIRIIRRGSPNPEVGVIVCGEVFRDHPEFVALVGADSMATDPLSSLSQARHIITRPTRRRLS